MVDVVTRRGLSRTHRRQQGDEELLVVLRYRARDPERVGQGAYALSNAAPETPLPELARVAKAAHRIAACLQRSKSAAGLADYEGRHWAGWQQQPTLALRATGCLERETHRGKKWTLALTFPQIRQGIAMIVREAFQGGTLSPMLDQRQKRWRRNELARFYPWKQRNRLAPLNLHKRQF